MPFCRRRSLTRLPNLLRTSWLFTPQAYGVDDYKATDYKYHIFVGILHARRNTYSHHKTTWVKPYFAMTTGHKVAQKIHSKGLAVGSLFAGCGGMDLGFVLEGFNVAWANDNNHWACETYKKNFGDHVIEGDVTKVDFEKLKKCDVILGGFPCQDFSMIWKRKGLGTDRGNLYRHFVRSVSTLRPKIFVAENVKGLLTANEGKAIKQIMADFSETGYRVQVHPVNFATYGAPQLRERVLIIGVRNDIKDDFVMPAKTHTPETYVGAAEAFKGVENALYNNEKLGIQPATIEKLKLIPPGGNFTDIPRNSPHYVKGMISHVYRRLHPNKPSTTIIAGGGGGTWGYHYSEPRPLTNRERARLFGYPDDFVFVGSVTEVRRQIGNSVPPVAIRVIARALKRFLAKV